MKIICILFHVGKNKNEITKDSKLRLFAGFELATGINVSKKLEEFLESKV